MSFDSLMSSILKTLSKPTLLFGLKLWIIILICLGILILFLCLICSSCRRRRRKRTSGGNYRSINTKSNANETSKATSASMLLSRNALEIDLESPDQRVMYSDGQWSGRKSYRSCSSCNSNYQLKRVNSVGGIKQFSLKEIETATNGFADNNVVGCGEYGVVYLGLLLDQSRVAVKKLIFNDGKLVEFIDKVEAMWCIRHRNLVKLLGYCIEGTYKMLVYEYVDNGCLRQWLHGSIGTVSPMSWNTRISIIQKIVKCLIYLHEDSEPSIIHQHIKSSNILLDRQWNPKVCDVGISKLLGLEWTSIMGMHGYMAPEYASTSVLNEKTDVYSLGVLIIEIITGKSPVLGDEGEGGLIEWLNSKVREQNLEEIVDPKLCKRPNKKEVKRLVLIALRCVDTDIENRPKVGDIIHMLEPRDLLLSDERVLKTQTLRRCYSEEMCT